jgi:hypothetical protein
MPCTKRELIEAINSYANARLTNDTNLINLAAKPLQDAIDSLEFSDEPEPPVAEPESSDSVES